MNSNSSRLNASLFSILLLRLAFESTLPGQKQKQEFFLMAVNVLLLYMNDIQSEEDIATLVHTFYGKVRADEVLSPVLNAVIKGDWDAHLQRMCDFWSSLLLYTRKYMADPMEKHMPLPLERKHFERWLALFNGTVAQLFEGENANEAKRRAGNIARVMQSMMNIVDG